MIPPTTAQLHLWACQFRTKFTAPDCLNQARIIVRYIEDGGAPSGQTELCNTHSRIILETTKAADVPIHDMRK